MKIVYSEKLEKGITVVKGDLIIKGTKEEKESE
jgi:hypothetical protein